MADLLVLDPAYMMLPIDETPFAINADTRVITTPRIVVLQNDQIAETVIFTIDRYFDYMDLYNANAYVQWTLPDGTEGATEIEFRDIETIPGKIRFGWPLDSDVTSQVGQVKFSVRFWQRDTMKENGVDVEKVVYSFNTLTSSLTVSPSLQVKVNDAAMVNTPVAANLFKRAIMNSQLTGEGTPLPLAPTFAEPGLNLPDSASLKDNELTLKAQAIVGDTGSIGYEWYYKPATTETIDGHEFVAGVEYPFKDTINADGETVYGFEAFQGTVNNSVYEEVPANELKNGLVLGEYYYTQNSTTTPTTYESYAGTEVPADGTKLYQRFTTYTVPHGEGKDDIKVTGDYCVRATNTIGKNTTTPHASRVCRLVSPDAVEIKTNLAATAIIPAEGKATLSIKTNTQQSNGAVMSYAWIKDIKENSFTADTTIDVDTTTKGTLDVNTPGWYKVTASALLNREVKDATSSVCKVTFEPQLPTMTYTVETDALDKENGLPLFSGDADAVLEIVEGSIIPTDYEDYAKELFSESLTYTWTIANSDGTGERILGEADKVKNNGRVVDGLNSKVLTVKATGSTPYRYACHVTNTLNGKTISSKDAGTSLAFIVM